MPIISIIIPTFDRGDSVINTIHSILKNSYKNIEIIVVEQGNFYAFKNYEHLLTDKRIRYLKLNKPNASKAKNFGIQKSKGKYIAFTDDDCIVTTNWLKNILLTFKKNKSAVAIFGSIYEYRSYLHKKQTCPSVFKKTDDRVILKPVYHKDLLGFGNNFIVKRNSLLKYGGFKEWLGPGSVGLAAEDAELALRILLNRGMVVYNHKVKIMHNKWLSPPEMGRQMYSYNCGEIACYGYLYLTGNKFAKKIIEKNLIKQSRLIKSNFKKYFKSKISRSLPLETAHLIVNLIYELKGILIAISYGLKYKILGKS